MRETTIHCAARGHPVRVLLTDAPAHDGQASLHDPELLCLSIGERCGEADCPLHGESPTAMDAQLARAGLGPAGRATVRGQCAGCDRVTDLALSHGGYATCAECGTTQHLEPFPGRGTLPRPAS